MGCVTQSTILPVNLLNVYRLLKILYQQIQRHICNKVTHHNLYLAILPFDLSLITIHISDCRQFSDTDISQGSVATYLRCGGIFKYEFVANLPLSLSAKEL